MCHDKGFLAFLMVILLTGPATAKPDPLLVDVLAELPEDARLEITCSDRSSHKGTRAELIENRLLLAPLDADHVAEFQLDIPLEAIVLVRRLESGADRGFKSGAITGAMVGGGMGFLAASLFSSPIGPRPDTGAVLLGVALIGGAGGMVGGAIGLNVGASDDTWRTLYVAPGHPGDTQRHATESGASESATSPSPLRAGLCAGGTKGKYNPGNRRHSWFGQLTLTNRRSSRSSRRCTSAIARECKAAQFGRLFPR